MAKLLETSYAGQVIELPAGRHRGWIRALHDFRLVGPGARDCIVEATGEPGDPGSILQPGAAVSLVGVRGVAFDAAGHASIGAPLEAVVGGIAELDLDDVAVLRTHRGAVAVDNRGRINARGLWINGDGGGIRHRAGARGTCITGARQHGGRFGFVNVTGGPVGSQPGIHLTSYTGAFHYWANPRGVACEVTGIGPQHVDVVAHNVDERRIGDVLRLLVPLDAPPVDLDVAIPRCRGARAWDRIETADRRWAEVLAVGPRGELLVGPWHAPGSWAIVPAPGGRATLLRPVLGTYFGLGPGTPTRLMIATPNGAPLGHWRGVEGDEMGTPVLRPGTRMDILRVNEADRDLDTGGVLIGETALAPVLTDVAVIGTWSDGITVYAQGAVLAACRSVLSQDMGFTLGDVRALACVAERAGRNGYSLNGRAQLHGCLAEGNGLHRDGPASGGPGTVGGVGVDVNASALDAFLDVVCRHNSGGAVVGMRTTADQPLELWR